MAAVWSRRCAVTTKVRPEKFGRDFFMQKAAIQILIASGVFYLLTLGFEVLGRGAALSVETLLTCAFRTVIFSMIYAALVVGMIIIRGEKK